uniref:non-specific serine/threonine protein kinase n=1 Tax=Rhodosorus marinus TaxID=101924 RepID=A0A7S0BPV6_9RHOD|mmetsp:Transcript_3237/g.4649  ORF Transcript_3237/g.4649 Transcript_3237/m.4649 type:complete len:373 (+) Transcript_3237:307-1425(+)
MGERSTAEPRSQYEIGELLGRGSSGLVYRAVTPDGLEVAIKKIPLSKDSMVTIQNEIDMMKSAECAYFVELVDDFYVEEEDEMWIVQEYCPGGSLADVMEFCSVSFTEPQVRWAINCIVHAVDFLHRKSRIHRDVKAANTLLTKDGGVRLTDLGVAALLDEKTQSRQTAIGSPYWMAPEVIQKSMYGKKADIWSIGITAIELAEGAPPMKDVHPFRALFVIPSQPPPTLSVNPANWSNAFHDFVKCCLQKDPALRPSVEDLLKHEFLQNPQKDCLAPLVEQVISKMEEVRQSLDVQAAKQSSEGNPPSDSSPEPSDDDEEDNTSIVDNEAECSDSEGSLVVRNFNAGTPQTTSTREDAYKRFVEKLKQNPNS